MAGRPDAVDVGIGLAGRSSACRVLRTSNPCPTNADRCSSRSRRSGGSGRRQLIIPIDARRCAAARSPRFARRASTLILSAITRRVAATSGCGVHSRYLVTCGSRATRWKSAPASSSHRQSQQQSRSVDAVRRDSRPSTVRARDRCGGRISVVPLAVSPATCCPRPRRPHRRSTRACSGSGTAGSGRRPDRPATTSRTRRAN